MTGLSSLPLSLSTLGLTLTPPLLRATTLLCDLTYELMLPLSTFTLTATATSQGDAPLFNFHFSFFEKYQSTVIFTTKVKKAPRAARSNKAYKSREY